MDVVHLPVAPVGTLQQTVYQYSLCVVLPDCITQMLLQQQAFFTAQYGYVCSTPRLIMASFKADEALEDTLLRYLHRIAGILRSLPLTFNNYSGMPEHSVYVRLQEYMAFGQWVQALQPIANYILDNGFPKMQIIQRPHIPLAAALPPNVYRKAITHYAQQVFYAAFTATEWVLLKYKPNYGNQVPLCKFHLL
ncbi:MAG: hypothetical protein GTN67_06560 [Hydrotalea flava]|uniref:hypothetical protein n=1 Tax=Hydrotalea lipotrueae TaxID=2803817 RepID=UPI0016BA380E|nr:hypothetical protein [Hydrotalea lipotrueae]NIM35089.1 hypothetical protein [Hydrotalea flava]NIM37915.1 hypothetical protein [Hydrotalea flava]NIN03084.1 hypothetical protein [Hydrotalea flava]NIN14769.1 hypothetical protein [Hydrotalea flava]NIO93841.1 hypothetical protein [Hydrotalea flava]